MRQHKYLFIKNNLIFSNARIEPLIHAGSVSPLRQMFSLDCNWIRDMHGYCRAG